MSRISRRTVISTALALPLVAPAATAASGSVLQPTDQLVEAAAAWIAEHERREANIRRWQTLENSLFNKARRLKMDCELACRSNMPEARAMRALDPEIDEAFHRLIAAAGRASRMKARTIAGAIAKIELGLAVQGPYDWQDHALELAQGGLAELRTLASR